MLRIFVKCGLLYFGFFFCFLAKNYDDDDDYWIIQGREQCQPNEFRCTNSRCIPMGNRCDTICDCATHCEDELDCDEYYTKIDGKKILVSS